MLIFSWKKKCCFKTLKGRMQREKVRVDLLSFRIFYSSDGKLINGSMDWRKMKWFKQPIDTFIQGLYKGCVSNNYIYLEVIKSFLDFQPMSVRAEWLKQASGFSGVCLLLLGFCACRYIFLLPAWNFRWAAVRCRLWQLLWFKTFFQVEKVRRGPKRPRVQVDQDVWIPNTGGFFLTVMVFLDIGWWQTHRRRVMRDLCFTSKTERSRTWSVVVLVSTQM
jgi:hypothetical protein